LQCLGNLPRAKDGERTFFGRREAPDAFVSARKLLITMTFARGDVRSEEAGKTRRAPSYKGSVGHAICSKRMIQVGPADLGDKFFSEGAQVFIGTRAENSDPRGRRSLSELAIPATAISPIRHDQTASDPLRALHLFYRERQPFFRLSKNACASRVSGCDTPN
jgi:hypothetical protein